MRLWCRVVAWLCAALACASAVAEEYPNRPIRLVVPYAPGQGADLVARKLAPRLSELLGQPLVIENRAGAGGNIGSDLVAKAKPDGYTLVLGTSATHAANQFLYSSISYDAANDFTPIVPIVSYGMILAVPAASPFKSLSELVAQARAKPKGLEAALPSTTSRLVLETFRAAAGVDIVPVPYVGTPPAITDAMSGRVAMLIDTSSALLGQIHAGSLRPLAMATEKRMDAYPDVPTFTELGFQVVVPPMNGFFGPRHLPPEVVRSVNAAVNKAFADRELRESFVKEGAQPLGGTPEDLDRGMRIERAKWEPVVKATGLRVQ
jgi:tripartite-type tricarboxylate transporter receptor subunit TctC